jgi:hypothetical protein
MSNSSIATVVRPEVAVIHNTAASTVALGAAGAAEILTNGAAQGALAIRSASTHPTNYTAAAGEYAVANHGRVYMHMEVRAAKGIAGSVMSIRVVLGAAGDAADGGTTIMERQIPAAAGLNEYYISAPDIAFDVAPGQVLTVQIESDTLNDSLVIADLCVVYKSIPLVLGAAI